MILCLDAEWNGDKATEIYCICIQEYNTGAKITFTKLPDFAAFVDSHSGIKWAIHNGLNADVPVINGIAGRQLINPDDVIDTFVSSRLFDYKKYNTHSLAEIGKALGVHKGDWTGGWDKFNPGMIPYCEKDVEVLVAILKSQWRYHTDTAWASAIKTEHQMAMICHEMNTNGFCSNTSKVQELLNAVNAEMQELEDSFAKAFAPVLVEDRRIKLRYTTDGKLYANVLKTMTSEPNVTVEGDELVVWKQKQFNPGSPKDRIDLLWDAGWKPVDKTDGHKKAERVASSR